MEEDREDVAVTWIDWERKARKRRPVEAWDGRGVVTSGSSDGGDGAGGGGGNGGDGVAALVGSRVVNR